MHGETHALVVFLFEKVCVRGKFSKGFGLLGDSDIKSLLEFIEGVF